MTTFFERLALTQEARNSLLCVGLDPYPERFPAGLGKGNDAIFNFNKAIIDATADLVCCFKPQIAHYAAVGAEVQLAQTIDYIREKRVPVLLDAKRGDVSSTADCYAKEVFERYGADATTVNPYLGLDAMEPYLAYKDKGVFILCRTSNPGGADLQNLALANGKQLFEHVAEQAASCWNTNRNVGLVVGATHPAELRKIRQLTGSMTFLIPGIGAQGGDVVEAVEAGSGGGMLLSSSRAILYASSGPDFAGAARHAAQAQRDAINRACIAA